MAPQKAVAQPAMTVNGDDASGSAKTQEELAAAAAARSDAVPATVPAPFHDMTGPFAGVEHRVFRIRWRAATCRDRTN